MSAVRKLAAPIADHAPFTDLVQDILDNNPWGCTTYVSAGVTVAGVIKGTESYTGAVVYEDAHTKTVSRILVKAPTSTGFTTNISTIVDMAELGTAMGGQVHHMTARRAPSV